MVVLKMSTSLTMGCRVTCARTCMFSIQNHYGNMQGSAQMTPPPLAPLAGVDRGGKLALEVEAVSVDAVVTTVVVVLL